MDLKDKKCSVCQGGQPALTMLEKQELFNKLSPHWSMAFENSRLQRSLKFKNFQNAMDFAIEIGKIAEQEQHHPEIHLGWGHCDLELWTHTNNDLTENDFILAAKIDEAFKRLKAS